ncbi:hypothetical protein GWK08_05655 [Leptobacterium flavescens]|uniref:DUF5673 domain-containing protein n=1 Tax=Leptobacterium flavescens TaxID=472055 RepID=A0A6P0UI37_9FLAO|nr:hypothetical protein [Leptobacterium flavescens]NER12914.1 hypothetical protein [Leptobacterium flavescens]
MAKQYKATNFYYFKMVLIILLIALVYFLYTAVFAALLNFGRISNIIIASVFGIVGLFAIFIVILSNKPVIIFEDEAIIYRYKKIFFSDIASFHPARGGSEPYIITKGQKRVDLELSWLTKKDRDEIEATLQSILKNE